MKKRERIETERLVLRKPTLDDAEVVFARYASDWGVTKFSGWPRHGSVADTRAFLEFSESEWQRWLAGPYLIESRAGLLLGSTGLAFETPEAASTGYVLARDAWGFGYATEALRAMVELAHELGVKRLYALCHREHRASARVLEKCGFRNEGEREVVFPNLGGSEREWGFYFVLG